jgi:rhodanese-related sulfurtransferase
MKLCHTCENNNMIYSSICNPKEADWIKREKLEPVPVNLNPKQCKIQFPKNSDIELTLTQKEIKPGKKVLYWAAKGKPINKADNVENALQAYGRKNNSKFLNFGCTKVKKDGKIVIKIQSPQCYVEKNKLWAKHIHFIEENDNNTWRKENFYTVLGLPVNTEEMKSKKLKSGNVYVTPEQVKKYWKNGNFYMVYALSKKYPSLASLERYKNFKHIQIDHENKNIRLPKEVDFKTPMVVYCAKKSCNAAKNLILKLADKGYENLFYMEEGMTQFSLESLNLLTEKVNKKSVSNYMKMSGL